MATIVLGNGLGQALGDYLATTSPLTMTGNVWYVHSATGTDGVSPAGKSDSKPLASLKQAISNAASGDIIVLMSGHTETSAADSDWDMTSKRLSIIGAGSSGGLPTAKLTCGNVGSLGGQIFFGTAYSQMRNVWVTARAAANVNPRVALFTTHCRLIGCYFECDQYDTGAAVSLDSNAGVFTLQNCTFKSTATSASAQPAAGLKSTVAIPHVRLDGCVFDNGTVGFSNFYAADLSAGAITAFEAEALSLLRGADIKMHASTTGWCNAPTVSGGSRVDW